MARNPCPLILDPEPGRARTLLYGTPPFDYVADTAEEWAVKGFAGFIRPDSPPGRFPYGPGVLAAFGWLVSRPTNN